MKRVPAGKPTALLCLSYFFHAFPDIEKIVLYRTFDEVTRLTPLDSSSRDVIRQAIDLLLPVLERDSALSKSNLISMDLLDEVIQKRSFERDGEGFNWSLQLKNVMSEGLQSQNFLIALQAIVRNRDLAFKHRQAFAPLMVDVLYRLGLANHAPLENRQLSVDIASTLYYWETKSASEEKILRPEMETTIINHLVRMAFVSCEVRDRDEQNGRKLHAHCFDVLKDAVRFRPPVSISLSFLERWLHNSSQGHDTSMQLITTLRIICLFMEYQPDNLLMHCVKEFAAVIERGISAKHRAPVELLANATRLLFA